NIGAVGGQARGVEYREPAGVGEKRRQHKGNLLMMGIHEQQKIVILNGLAAFIHFIHCFTRKQNSQTASELLVPLDICDLTALRTEPDNVLNFSSPDFSSLEKIAAAKQGMMLAQRDQPLNESQKLAVDAFRCPVQPADFIVLAVGVVIAQLSVPDSI